MQFGVLDAYAGVGGYRLRDKHVAVDGGTATDDGFAAQDAGIGVYHHIIFDGGVAFVAAEHLAATG